MQQPAPYIDGEGNRYYNVHQAAQVLEGVCVSTLWRWAEKGVTSFGFKLDVKSEPMKHYRRLSKGELPPKTPREVRMLIPETNIQDLKKILQAAGKNKPGPWSPAELATLEETTLAFRRRAQELDVGRPFPRVIHKSPPVRCATFQN